MTALDASARTPVAEASSAKAIVVVNARAGTVLAAGQKAFDRRIVAAFASHGIEARIVSVKGREFGRAVADALAQTDALAVIAGGDGTISRVLPLLARAKGRAAIMPLGTINLLARDLGLIGDLDAAITSIATGERAIIDLAEVNGRPFHSNAGIGIFAMMAREREVARRRFPFSRVLGFAWAASRTLLRSRPLTIEVTREGRHDSFVSDAVLVTNNAFAGSPWQRPRLDEGLLEVHMLSAEGHAARLRAAVAMASGSWRDLPALTSFTASEVEIRRPGRSRSTVAIDGEVTRIANPLRFKIRPAALTLPRAAKPETDA